MTWIQCYVGQRRLNVSSLRSEGSQIKNEGGWGRVASWALLDGDAIRPAFVHSRRKLKEGA